MNLQNLKEERDHLNAERNEHIEARSGHDKRARELAKSISHIEKEIIKAYERGETDAAATAAPATPAVPKTETPTTTSPPNSAPAAPPTHSARAKKSHGQSLSE